MPKTVDVKVEESKKKQNAQMKIQSKSSHGFFHFLLLRVEDFNGSMKKLAGSFTYSEKLG